MVGRAWIVEKSCVGEEKSEMLNREKICQGLGNNTCGRAGAEVGKHFSKGESEKYFENCL